MKKNMKGFTLIELMIVVAIIGVLAAIAIPNFMNYQCKAKQTEAKRNLGTIKTQQYAYRAEWDTYGSLSNIGFSIDTDARYSYSMSNNTSSFTATAAATVNGKGDSWSLNETGDLVINSNACQ